MTGGKQWFLPKAPRETPPPPHKNKMFSARSAAEIIELIGAFHLILGADGADFITVHYADNRVAQLNVHMAAEMPNTMYLCGTKGVMTVSPGPEPSNRGVWDVGCERSQELSSVSSNVVFVGDSMDYAAAGLVFGDNGAVSECRCKSVVAQGGGMRRTFAEIETWPGHVYWESQSRVARSCLFIQTSSKDAATAVREGCHTRNERIKGLVQQHTCTSESTHWKNGFCRVVVSSTTLV